MAHAGIGGLQKHSIGETYPFSIVIVECAENGRGYCVARNLISGETLTRYDYDKNFENSFERAHRAAEFQAAEGKALLQLEQPAKPQTLREFRVLVPELRDSDKTAQPPIALHSWRLWLSGFGGFTSHTVEGAWADENQELIYDRSQAYYIAVPRDREEQFLKSLGHWARVFDQQCLYVAEVSPAAQLVYAKS
jgi:hypothetical protein